ncbi:hypothetical protein EB230_14410 [Mesorhizobium sp. NZP2234]|nr:hypothetical protein EB230_14410 [Mesorhizobium sp. NZP2234]
MTREEDRSKFVKLASARVTKALNDIRLIGNLANRSNYDYTSEDVTKIFKALNEEISACKKRFELSNKKGSGAQFVLE